jgi:hypothetical protein
MDVLAVREAVAEHIRIAREERRPTLIEAFTYRYRGHSAADPEVYRTKEEVEEWRGKDPIESFGARLTEQGVLSAEQLEEIAGEVEKRVLGAVEFADNSPEPPLESLYDNLYVLGEQVEGWYAVDERTPVVHRGEHEHEVGREGTKVHELAEAGAAYGGQKQRPRHPKPDGDAPAEKATDDRDEDVAGAG